MALSTALTLGGAWAAMPDGGLGLERSSPAGQGGAPAAYPLDTEMVVRQWVMCVSQAVAEDLVRAREESVEQARITYAKLKDAHRCGQFSELRVILRERTHVSVVPGHEARIFKALVNLSDAWGSAFVVFGGLPEE